MSAVSEGDTRHRAHKPRARQLAAKVARRLQVERRASLFLPLAVLCLLVLFSYSAQDSSLNTAGESLAETRNWLGSAGAFLADLLVQGFGKASWLFAMILASFAVTRPTGDRAISSKKALFALATSLVLACAASAILSPAASARWPAGGGGVLGEAMRRAVYSGTQWIDTTALASAILGSICLFAATLSPRRMLAACVAPFVAIVSAVRLAATTLNALSSILEGRTQAERGGREEEALWLDNPVDWHAWHGTTQQETRQEPPRPAARKESLQSQGSPASAKRARRVEKTLVPETLEAGTLVPSLELLSTAQNPSEHEDEQAQKETSKNLEQTLSDYGVRGKITGVERGPVVTLYELEPAAGVKSSRIVSLAEDIARTMQCVSVRIAAVPGKNVIGIELPNKHRETVVLRELLAAADRRSLSLPLALGKCIDGSPKIVDLADMPHLLIAGTTGSGKSVGINAMILSLLYRHSPSTCRMLMIDPKMLELSVYHDIPHLLAPVLTESDKAVRALKWTLVEMDRRYRLMAESGVRNIEGYHRRQEKLREESLPYIVVIVDEMADLMLTSGRSIEMVLQRLAQMARAAGIHLIVATQRPSVDVITGTIKANFPTRISYQVASKFDSRTILNEQGAETLLGRGDMLFLAGGAKLERLHGPFVGDEEVESVCAFLRQNGEPSYEEAVLHPPETAESSLSAGGEQEDDPLYNKAVEVVVAQNRASTSFLQRQLQVGYNRAARIIDRMEVDGIIGPSDATGKRSVLVSSESSDNATSS